MSTSVPTTGPTPDDQSSGAALPATPAHPTSPGPNPDDINDEHDSGSEDEHARGAANATPTVSPTNPGPNPDDINH